MDSARKVERREFEYIRRGTLSFIVNFEVATGQRVPQSDNGETVRMDLPRLSVNCIPTGLSMPRYPGFILQKWLC